MAENKYTESDAAEETESSSKDVSEAWHQAREDAAGSGQLPERNESKVSDSEAGPELHDTFEKAGMIPKK
jgi:hypothetical protein